jgi:hypothetical protein
MSLAIAAVLGNAVVTFAGCAVLALLAAKVSGSARMGKYILLAPWLRVAWDVVHGPAADAYVFTDGARYVGVENVQLGLGRLMLPVLTLKVELPESEGPFAYSMGDVITSWLSSLLGTTALTALVCAIVGVSGFLLALRAREFARWRKILAALELDAVCRETVAIRWRSLEILTCKNGDLAPCTSGILRPRVWLPVRMSTQKHGAALEHELAHVRDADVLLFSVAGVFADLFWFIPGSRRVERYLRDTAERAADAAAIARGVAPSVLARTLIERAGHPLRLGAGMTASGASLRNRLIAITTHRSSGALERWVRHSIACVLTASVFLSLFGGYL